MAVQLYLKASNNEAKYEALLVGLQAAKYVGSVMIIMYSNSQLITWQLEGTYEVKNDRMRKYTKVYKKLKAKFQEVIL